MCALKFCVFFFRCRSEERKKKKILCDSSSSETRFCLSLFRRLLVAFCAYFILCKKERMIKMLSLLQSVIHVDAFIFIFPLLAFVVVDFSRFIFVLVASNRPFYKRYWRHSFEKGKRKKKRREKMKETLVLGLSCECVKCTTNLFERNCSHVFLLFCFSALSSIRHQHRK